MKHETLAKTALLAYPKIAKQQGDEMLATLLDSSEGSRRRFATELIALTRAGLHARALQSANTSTRRILANGICLSATWWITFVLSTMLAHRVRGEGPPYGPLHQSVASSPTIALRKPTPL